MDHTEIFLKKVIPNYVGALYPQVEDALRKIDQRDKWEVVLSGGMGSGKSYTAMLAMLMHIFRLSLDGPWPFYPEWIHVGFDFALIGEIGEWKFQELRQTMEDSPFFSEKIKVSTKTMVRLDNKICIYPVGADVRELSGLNITGAVIDHYGPERSQIYDAVRARIASRTVERNNALLIRIDSENALRIDLGTRYREST